jgi:hypothetical protein
LTKDKAVLDCFHANEILQSFLKGIGGVMSVKPFFVRAEWDEEARVWVATSDDVPGLATEEDSMEGLIEKLKVIIPELLEANGILILNPDTRPMQC